MAGIIAWVRRAILKDEKRFEYHFNQQFKLLADAALGLVKFVIKDPTLCCPVALLHQHNEASIERSRDLQNAINGYLELCENEDEEHPTEEEHIKHLRNIGAELHTMAVLHYGFSSLFAATAEAMKALHMVGLEDTLKVLENEEFHSEFMQRIKAMSKGKLEVVELTPENILDLEPSDIIKLLQMMPKEVGDSVLAMTGFKPDDVRAALQEGKSVKEVRAKLRQTLN
jgi:hypothetical protein